MINTINTVICDLDGTLVEGWGKTPLDGVLETLADLRRRNISVDVATNQTGPLWRAVTGKSAFPTAQDVANRLVDCAEELNLRDQAIWCVAIWDSKLADHQALPPSLLDIWTTIDNILHKRGISALVSPLPEWRKPGDGMLKMICRLRGIHPDNAIFVGDMDTDRQAAEAAGMRFVERVPDVLALLDGAKS